MKIFRLSLVLMLLLSVELSAQQSVAPLLSKDLPDLPGKEAQVMTVTLPPGYSGTVHRHNAHVFVYVLQGSILMQVKGGQPVTLGPGQTFYESPEDIHTVGQNLSKTEPAKFVAFFIKNKGAAPVDPVR